LDDSLRADAALPIPRAVLAGCSDGGLARAGAVRAGHAAATGLPLVREGSGAAGGRSEAVPDGWEAAQRGAVRRAHTECVLVQSALVPDGRAVGADDRRRRGLVATRRIAAAWSLCLLPVALDAVIDVATASEWVRSVRARVVERAGGAGERRRGRAAGRGAAAGSGRACEAAGATTTSRARRTCGSCGTCRAALARGAAFARRTCRACASAEAPRARDRAASRASTSAARSRRTPHSVSCVAARGSVTCGTSGRGAARGGTAGSGTAARRTAGR
jgi:hypothetical protein